MTQVRFTQSLKIVGLQARAASRVIASPRAGLSFAASRVSSSAPTLTFTSSLSTITMADANPNNSANKRPRASNNNNRRNAPVKKARSFHTTPAQMTDRKFSELEGKLDKRILRAISDNLKFEKMSPVQAATTHLLPPDRPDALVQAKTGTGKTLAFLMPAIQRCIDQGFGNGSVSAVIIAPTRELAMQIATEARALLQHVPKHRVEVVMGTTNKLKEEKRILEKADILVATPGRLLDHMQNETVLKIFSHVDTIILDEADRLLDMGFRRDLTQIIEKIPHQNRNIQGLLFSATVPQHVQDLAGLVCRNSNFQKISTIPEGETQTHERVPQDLIEVSNFSEVGPALVGCIKQEAARPDLGGPLKAIVFAPTSQQVDYYERVLSNVPGLPPVSALHGRKTQSRRTKTTNDFRTAGSAILVATDVVARGMDFPGVTTVLQAGVPEEKENYIHRLGRTARAEADGRGVLIVANAEKSFLQKKFTDLPLTPREANLDAADEVAKTNKAMPYSDLERLYRSWMAYYFKLAKHLGWSQEELVKNANAYVMALGSQKVPGMTAKSVGKLGLKKNTPGLVIDTTSVKPPNRRGPPPAAKQRSKE